MKPILAAAALLIFASGPALAWERIATEQQFRDNVVDRQVVTPDGNTFTSHADGRVSGVWSGQQLVGGWQWHEGYWCRNVRLGDGPETGTDCQLIELRGNQLRSTRNRGRGEAAVGTVQ